MDLITAYCIACGVSISVAMSLRMGANKALAGKTGFAVAIAGNVINYAAVMLSTNANVFFIRRGELSTGITVKDEKSGVEFGSSQTAAKTAIRNTMFSRTIYTIPIFFVPALWNMTL